MRVEHSQNGIGNFENIKTAATGEHTLYETTGMVSGYRLDIQGVTRDNALSGFYGKNGLEKEEKSLQESCFEGIAGQDVSLQRNYLAVMSNTLSDEDYKELSEDGFRLGDMPAEESVTVIDQIKVKLAEAGVEVKGYTDTLDHDTLVQVTGSEGRSACIEQALKAQDLPATRENIASINKALSMADELSECCTDGGLSENAKRYMIAGGLEGTLENIYNAQFMSSPYMGSNGLTEDQRLQMEPQIKNIIESAGLEYDEKLLEDAYWLIDNGQAVTGENIKALEELNEVSLPIADEKLIRLAADSISRGDRAQEALLVRNERIMTQARITLTLEADKRFLLTGEEPDIRALDERVEVLKEKEQQLLADKELYAENESYRLDENQVTGDPVRFYDSVNTRLEAIKLLPADTIAEFAGADSFSLNDVYESGSSLAAKYAEAEQTYEALGTKVRSDLGDSLTKAFSNVEDILQDMGYEKTADNARAVRILGYNRMEITEENISAVKEADARVNACLDALKPASVLRLVREGSNPLSMDVSELEETLRGYEDQETRDDKYSSFLLRLERNNEISQEEKESYLGIYRLFRQVEKSDGAVIGGLINNGEAITLKNLLSQTRSRRARGMDYSVDDSFGGLEQKLSENSKAIDTQISQAFDSRDYYSRRTGDILSLLDPDKMSRLWEGGAIDGTASVEEIYEAMLEESPESSEGEKLYASYMADSIRENAVSDEDTVNALLQYDLPVTAENLQAMGAVLFDRGDVYRQLSRYKKAFDTRELIEDFETEDGAKAAMEDLVENSQEMINELKETADISFESLEELRLLSRQIHMIGEMSRQNSYEVPVEIDGELTSINLKLVQGQGESEVYAALYSQEYGSMSVKLSAGEDGFSGYMLADNSYGARFLEERKEEFIKLAEEEGFSISGQLPVMTSKDIRISAQAAANPAKKETGAAEETAENPEAAERMENFQLYKLAKLFLTVMNK